MDVLTDYAGNTIEVYTNAIEEQIYIFYEQFAPEDVRADRAKLDKFICDSTQQSFNACLMHINKTVFRDKRALKEYPYTSIPNTTFTSTNRNSYSIDMLNEILIYYVYICALYDKSCSIHGFSYLTGVSREYLARWTDSGGYNVTPGQITLLKNLHAACESSLADILTSGKRNPVSILGLLNHYYNWNMPGVREQSQKQVLAADQLPLFGNLHNAAGAIESHETPTNGVK